MLGWGGGGGWSLALLNVDTIQEYKSVDGLEGVRAGRFLFLPFLSLLRIFLYRYLFFSTSGRKGATPFTANMYRKNRIIERVTDCILLRYSLNLLR